MHRELFEELKHLGIVFVLVLVGFQIAFFKQDLIDTLRIVASIFWLFVIPGYVVLRAYGDALAFIEKLVIGTVLSAGIIGILSYYFGIAGFPVWYHQFILPSIIILVGGFLNYRIMKKKSSHAV